MSTVYLERMFRPRSVAVVGANNRPQRVGGVVMRNLLAGGFEGPIMPVNPRYEAVAGVLTYPDVASLPRTPDLAILCTPPETVPDLVDELGARGTRAVVVVARNLSAARDGPSLQERMLAAARAHGVRLLGGGTLGLLVPRMGLNASFSRVKALPGEIGFVSQSDAVGTLVLDWAHPRRIGFSHFISLGDAADIGFGEALDYLGSDPDTRAILLYIESLRERRSFMAAARGAARNKPVVAIKAGRRPPGRGPPAPLSSDTLSLVEPDDVFDAALRRAGILRVRDVEELFSAVGTLGRARPRRGQRLAVVSNGGGAGMMAADELHGGGLALPPLSDATQARLRPALPAGWDGQNPIDIQVDAPGSRYAEVLRILIESREFDTLLAIHTPSTLASSTEAARAVIETAARQPCNVLTCWIGGEMLAAARKMLVDAGLATFDTPADAARAFRFTVSYERAREALLETPPSVPVEFRPDPDAARAAVRRALEEGRDYLRAPERTAVFRAYGIPVVDTQIADTPEQAARAAAGLGFPVELAIRSPDVRRKREVGGVALSLETTEAVEAAARTLAAHLSVWRPDARLTGFTVQRMLPRPHARQLFVGVAEDPLFGPVILFGEGRATEGFVDFSVGLPPLNLPLARALVARTRVARLLEASPTRPAADLDAICLALVKVSQLVVDLPEIVEMDVNPLLADEGGVVAAGSFVRVARAGRGEDRLAIRPYPRALEERARLPDGREVVLRPIRPEDEASHDAFLARLSPEDSRFRFFHYVRSLPHSELARLTQIDYDREMAFIATAPGPGGEPETLGVVRSVSDPDNVQAEFSVVVRSDLKRRGIATLLLRKLLDYCRRRGTRDLVGDVLADNAAMLELVRREGGALAGSAEEGIVRVVFPLQEAPPPAPGR
ncbi:MAG TPA: bifunctional acetate--CoA ligase family protein/GNAT family N-acetyltransferase [Anaeromyxobacteraceae bacterium]|nr:bifunctional acetate--CoA ligase family protein/GNAT family N-acetyltransferase [Anaeromyxobacteraceae bacterium]